MQRISRRIFMGRVVAGVAVLVVAARDAGAASAGPSLDEADPQAAALGYKADARQVDGRKYPQRAPGQTCGNCRLFEGAAADAAGGCAVFPGKTVARAGWCCAWVQAA